MILNGLKLLVNPTGNWSPCLSRQLGTGGWILAAAFTAVVFPAVAVVLGHMGSFLLGHVTEEIAIQRAAVGLIAVVGGAAVVAPAYTLLLIKVGQQVNLNSSVSELVVAAMGVIWPVWLAGIVLVFPPLIGLGPEVGELLWALLTIGICVRTLKKGAVQGLSIHRRWQGLFVGRSALYFVFLFVVVLIGPALGVRSIMGIEGERAYHEPGPAVYPLPPDNNW